MVEAWVMTERAGEDAPAKKRVLVAGLFHQTNTIVKGRTGLEDFEIRRGQEMLRSEVQDLPLDGLIDAARQNAWELLPVVGMRAASGATVTGRLTGGRSRPSGYNSLPDPAEEGCSSSAKSSASVMPNAPAIRSAVCMVTFLSPRSTELTYVWCSPTLNEKSFCE